MIYFQLMGKRLSKDTGLTDQQELFCQEYLKDLNGKQSAIRAKYSEKGAEVQASRLLSNAKVSARINELTEKRSKRLEITADKVLQDIEEVRVRCMQGEPILNKDGKETGMWEFEAHAALKASELQGKHIELFTDKVKHSGSVTFENLSDADLDKRINELLKKQGAK